MKSRNQIIKESNRLQTSKKSERLQLLENKIRKMVREELLVEENPRLGDDNFNYSVPWRDFYNEMLRLYNDHHDDLEDIYFWITATEKFLKHLRSEEKEFKLRIGETLIREGLDVQWGPSVDSRDKIMKLANEELNSGEIPSGIRKVIWIGEKSEDVFYKLATQNQNSAIVVGIVDGEYTYAYGYRS